MESESLQPQISPEHPDFSRAERSEKPPLQTPEVGIVDGAERYEQRSESGAVAADGAPTLPPTLPLVPLAQVSVASDSAAAVVSDDTPAVANDDDLIEKEWVDKAKKIIVETKDDPYRREEAVGRLQRDYLEKRYGRKIGSAGDAD